MRSLALLVAGSATVGIGIGLTVGAGLAAINADAPPERRGEAASTFFAILYLALALPAIGVGLATEAIGLRAAGIVFSAIVALLALAVLAELRRGAGRVTGAPRAPGTPR
jgi:MFS family permease